MTEPHPNTLCHTVYTDRTIGLTVTAWPPFKSNRFWMVHFHRWHHKAARQLLDQTAPWGPLLGWGPKGHWRPGRAPLIPPAALAAVEAWLAEQAAEVVK